jgi:cytochrome d ubiquinol oxidase subunit II
VTLADALAGAILLSLMAYAITAGADFGGGVWDLLARGPTADRQREVIAKAIGPIWEANHVWMIVAVTLLFSACPPAFALIMTYLHVPVTLLLVGIVLRGSAFVFRKTDPSGEAAPSAWQRVFAISSLLTPVMLGVVLGTLSTEAVGPGAGFWRPWLQPFPWMVGVFTLVLFAFLAATYLTLETVEPALVERFRRHALASAAAAALAGVFVGALAARSAPEVAEHLAESAAGRLTLGIGAAAWTGAVLALRARRFHLARVLAATVAVAVVGGWGFGLHPWIVTGALSIEDAAAPPVTLRLVGGALVVGSVILFPAYAYLLHTFKRSPEARRG